MADQSLASQELCPSLALPSFPLLHLLCQPTLPRLHPPPTLETISEYVTRIHSRSQASLNYAPMSEFCHKKQYLPLTKSCKSGLCSSCQIGLIQEAYYRKIRLLASGMTLSIFGVGISDTILLIAGVCCTSTVPCSCCCISELL